MGIALHVACRLRVEIRKLQWPMGALKHAAGSEIVGQKAVRGVIPTAFQPAMVAKDMGI